VISQETLESWKAERHIQFSARVSAKTGLGIAEAFETWIAAVVATEEIPPRPALQIPIQPQRKESDCC
jgi:hypothetical protein